MPLSVGSEALNPGSGDFKTNAGSLSLRPLLRGGSRNGDLRNVRPDICSTPATGLVRRRAHASAIGASSIVPNCIRYNIGKVPLVVALLHQSVAPEQNVWQKVGLALGGVVVGVLLEPLRVWI